jgi:hypothetical protein
MAGALLKTPRLLKSFVIITLRPKIVNKHIFVTKGQLLGTIAKYAVQQSPYHRPDNLEVVLDKFNDLIAPAFDKADLGVGEFSERVTLEAFISRFLRRIPEYEAWNERKNGNDAPMKFTSRYDTGENPDDDFIDLDALERNVAFELERDQA